jgi:GNAT superfamily N-acetyltransferase
MISESKKYPHLRLATNVDSAAVKELVFGILREHGLEPDPAATDKDLDDIEAHYQRNGGSFSVFEAEDGTIVGSVGIGFIAPGICELRKMYVSRDHRGQGLGKALLNHGLAEARRLGYRRMVLETASVLKEAIRMYEQYGFRRYKPEHMVPRCDQAYCMEL